MSNGRHIMVDIETLGAQPKSVILSIGACAFDGEGIHKTFYRNIDVLESLLAGCFVEEKTVKWWRTQSAEAVSVLMSKQVTLRAALGEFNAFCGQVGKKEDLYFWAKGPDFDLVLLHSVYEMMGMEVPWHYRNVRDVRTILEVGRMYDAEEVKDFIGIDHFALDDARYQAIQVMVVYRAMGKEL